MRFKILAFHLLLFCSVFGQYSYQGLLWEINGNGLDKPSYLYGTMHVSNKVAFHLSDSFYRAIESVDVVSLEINPETWMKTMTSDDYVADKMGNVFSMRNGNGDGGFYKTLFSIEQPKNKQLGTLMSAELGILNSLLYRTSNYSADFQEDTYLDLFIYQAGRKQGKEITGLENLGITMKLNEQAAKPTKDKELKKLEKEIADRKQYLLTKLLDGKNYSEVMEDAYRVGDLDLLDSLSRLGGSDKNHNLIIVYRNLKMAEAMDSIMQIKSLFAGIGAAHLPNDYGVINLLREMGYSVRPVRGDKNDYSRNTKDRLEETFVKHPFKKQVSFDGSFSTMMPGQLYEFPESSGIRMAAYPDMANGARYIVTRVNTYAPLFGKSQQQYLDKLDSLFFENIPGKILSKESITVDGVPGYDITNRTKKGDLQRYNIFVTPVEVLIFKASGKKDFVNRDEVNLFFDEIKFLKNTKTESYSPRNDAYSVVLPGTQIYEGENNAFIRGFWEKSVQSYDGDEYFLVNTRSHLDIEYMEEDSFELHHILKFYASQFGYEVETITHDSFLGYASVSGLAQKDDATDLYVKGIIKGHQYYLLTALTPNRLKAQVFFQSLKFNDFQFSRPFTLQHDSARLFSVYSNVRPPLETESYYNYYDEDDDEDLSHQDETKAAIYYNKESDETVFIRYYKFHKYYSVPDLDSLWNIYRNEIKQGTYFVRNEQSATVNDVHIFEIEVGDTNTNRNILAKHYLKNGLLYSLYTETDFKRSRSKFINQFFTTFSPWDTVIGKSVLDDKVSLFLSDLSSDDSLTREAAHRSFDVMSFEDEDVPRLIAAYRNYTQFSKPQEDRMAILEEIAKLQHPKAVSFLLEEYEAVGDAVQYQLPILKALAAQQTKESTEAFCKLVLQDPPLSDTRSDINQIFYPYYDSLEVATDLYPELLKLTTLREYKMPVYELLSSLIDSNLVKPKKYRKYWKDIAWQAVNEVKRHRAKESDQDEDFYKTESRSTLYSYNDLLKYYATILHPYLSKGKANEFFQRAEGINSPLYVIDLALIKLKGGEEVPASYFEEIAKNKNDRIVLYQRLRKLGRLDLFPSKYDHDSLAMALYAQKARINQYKDSLVFVSKDWVNTTSDTGYLYFYKIKEEDGDDWDYGYIGLIDTTKAEVERYTYEYDDDLYFNKYESETLQIEMEIRKFEMKDRKRYSVADEPKFKALQSSRSRYRFDRF